MAFFMDPGAMFLGCLNGVEQKFLIELIKTARRSGYTRFVEPCAGTFAMANLAVQSGFKPEQIETSDVNMMTSVMGYAITGQSLEPLQIHAQGFSDEELLDPAVALYAQIYLRTSKSAGNEYFHNILRDLHDRREEHIESIRRQLEATKSLLGGMSYRPLDMWDHLREVKDDPHTIIVANPPTYFAGYEKFYDTQGKMTWKEPPYGMFDPETGHQQLYDMMMDAPALLLCYNDCIRTGQIAQAVEWLTEMAEILESEKRYTDALKLGMLTFYFATSGVYAEPVIEDHLAKQVCRVVWETGLTLHEREELFLDTIRDDTLPEHIMSAKDCAYIFDVCAAGRVEDAREMLGRFVTAHAAK